VMIAHRDGLDPNTLPTALRAASDVAGPIRLRLDCAKTQARLTTRLRGARTFLRVRADHTDDSSAVRRIR